MQQGRIVTRTRMAGAQYPALLTVWSPEPDGMGWIGDCEIWVDGDTVQPDCKKHTVSLRQGSPIGSINVMLDGHSYGCWSMSSFEGVGITERDLQWAACWAVEAIERRHMASRCLPPKQKDENSE